MSFLCDFAALRLRRDPKAQQNFRQQVKRFIRPDPPSVSPPLAARRRADRNGYGSPDSEPGVNAGPNTASRQRGISVFSFQCSVFSVQSDVHARPRRIGYPRAPDGQVVPPSGRVVCTRNPAGVVDIEAGSLQTNQFRGRPVVRSNRGSNAVWSFSRHEDGLWKSSSAKRMKR